MRTNLLPGEKITAAGKPNRGNAGVIGKVFCVDDEIDRGTRANKNSRAVGGGGCSERRAATGGCLVSQNHANDVGRCRGVDDAFHLVGRGRIQNIDFRGNQGARGR